MPDIMGEKQERGFMTTPRVIFFLFLFIASSACKDSDTQNTNTDFFPPVQVNTNINLSFPQYSDLNNIQGYAYLTEGYRGIIVYHTIDDRFVAFDRTCSYNTNQACAYVSMDSNRVQLRCGQFNPAFTPCCNSVFDAASGTVISGNARIPLRQYFTSRQGNVIYISNVPI
jgi:nitrite reductase/ring-hydroxylating ferredoxin subunit